jgi:hypothetical protein
VAWFCWYIFVWVGVGVYWGMDGGYWRGSQDGSKDVGLEMGVSWEAYGCLSKRPRGQSFIFVRREWHGKHLHVWMPSPGVSGKVVGWVVVYV